MQIVLQGISKSFGSTPVLDDIQLSIESNEFFFLLGPSGCGKTTLLRLIAGFTAPDRGTIQIGADMVTDIPPEKRNAPMVFQGFALWPHMNVFENVAYGLRVRKLPGDTIRQRVHEILEVAQLAGLEKRFPNQLSGGQQQRVAIARALVIDPGVLLFDEPLSNLDAGLRLEMREELRSIHERRPFTAVYVTHDQEEALSMATRIAIMEKGRVRQLGTPSELYRKPADRFCAEFLGPMNWIQANVISSSNGKVLLRTHFSTLTWHRSAGDALDWSAGDLVELGFRPGAVSLTAKQSTWSIREILGGERSRLHFRGVIRRIQYLGETRKIHLALSPPEVPPDRPPGGGDQLSAPSEFLIIERQSREDREVGDPLFGSIEAEDLIVVG
jgi:ABC-type Fe3+/spermidine/putrescine transport system ATPase subunit